MRNNDGGPDEKQMFCKQSIQVWCPKKMGRNFLASVFESQKILNLQLFFGE
jgi:hypothetical protein